MKYMGGAAEQAIFDSVKDRCWNSAYEASNYYENARKYSIMYAECVDRAFKGRGGRYKRYCIWLQG